MVVNTVIPIPPNSPLGPIVHLAHHIAYVPLVLVTASWHDTFIGYRLCHLQQQRQSIVFVFHKWQLSHVNIIMNVVEKDYMKPNLSLPLLCFQTPYLIFYLACLYSPFLHFQSYVIMKIIGKTMLLYHLLGFREHFIHTTTMKTTRLEAKTPCRLFLSRKQLEITMK